MKENRDLFEKLSISGELMDHGYSSSEEYLQIKGKNIPSDMLCVFYSKANDNDDSIFLFVYEKKHIDKLIMSFYSRNKVDKELIIEHKHSGDFDKSYIDVIDYIILKLCSCTKYSYSMDLARYIEGYIIDEMNINTDDENRSPLTKVPPRCDECKQKLGEMGCSNRDNGSFCSVKCADKSYQRDHGGKTDYYNIPEWVTDLDTLAESWNLSHYEFNVLKGVFGASRIRQGLDGRHSASNDDKERDFNKVIHYSKMMLESFNRGKQ